MRPSGPVRWTALVAVSLAVFFVSLDATFWPIAASTIANDLNTDASGIQLVLVVLALVSGPLYLITGPLGELQGRRKLFILGAIRYGISDVVIILASSFEVLLWVGIPLRGIGQAMIMPMTLGLILANYTHEQRSTAFAARGISITVAVLAGPLIMGLMAENLNWRGAFAIEAALVLIAVLLALRLAETGRQTGQSLDWVGGVMAFMGVAALLLGAQQASTYGWWLVKRPFVVAGIQINPLGLSIIPYILLFGVVMLVALVHRSDRREAQGKRPLFRKRLFANRHFTLGFLLTSLVFIMAGAYSFVVPVFLQGAPRFGAMDAAWAMVFLSIGSILAGLASPRLVPKIALKRLLQVALVVVSLGLLLLARVVSPQTSLGQLVLPMVVVGAGLGIVFAQGPNVTFATLSEKDAGAASGLTETGKEMQAIGVAAIGSLLLTFTLGGVVDGMLTVAGVAASESERQAVVLQLEDAQQSFGEIEWQNEIAQLPPRVQQALPRIVETSQVQAMHSTLLAMILVLLLALSCASFIPKIDSRNKTVSEDQGSVRADEHEQVTEALTEHGQELRRLFRALVSIRGGCYRWPANGLAHWNVSPQTNVEE